MAVKYEFTGGASECQALRYAQHSNEKLRHRRQQLDRNYSTSAPAFFSRKRRLRTLPNMPMIRKICEYQNIRSVSARKYRKSDNQSKTISVQL